MLQDDLHARTAVGPEHPDGGLQIVEWLHVADERFQPDLAPLDEARTYQLWVLTPDELAISAGVLGNDPAPSRFTWSGDVAGFALTREVAGGVETTAGDVVSVAEL